MSTEAKPDEEYSSLVRAIAMATIALRGHRQGRYETAYKRVVQHLEPAQHVASVVHTGPLIPLPESSSPTSSEVAVSLVILPDSGAVHGLVLKTRDVPRGTAQNVITTHTLTSSKSGTEILDQTGKDILDQVQKHSPHNHASAMYAIYRSLNDGPLEGLTTMKLSLFAVAGAYSKLVDRLLIVRQLWGNTWMHPMDVLKYAWLGPTLPWKVKLYVVDAAIKLESCGIPRPPLSSGGFYRYSVTEADAPKWVSAFTESYHKLEETLLNESKTACKEQLCPSDVLDATVHLIVLHGLLQSGFMERFLENRELEDVCQRYCESNKFHSCVVSGSCWHPIPQVAPAEQPATKTDSSLMDANLGPEIDDLAKMVELIRAKKSADKTDNADSSLSKESSTGPDAPSSTCEDSLARAESVPEPSTTHSDDSLDDVIHDSEMLSSSSADSTPQQSDPAQTTSEDESPPSGKDAAESQAMQTPDQIAPTPKPTIQVIVKPEDVRSAEEFSTDHLSRHLKALVAPLSASRALLALLRNAKRPSFPTMHSISVPASNPALPLDVPVPDAEREAFLDSVVERITESSKGDWSRRRAARDWLSKRLLDTPVSSMTAADKGYVPVPQNKDGGGIDPVPRVHPEAAMMGLACLFSSGRGSEVAIRPESESPTQDNAHAETKEDEDTRRALERIFSVHELPIGLPDRRRCCWCCWRLRQWLNNCDSEDTFSDDPIVTAGWVFMSDRIKTSASAQSGPRPACPNFLLPGSSAIVQPWIPPAEGMGVPVEFLRVLLDELLEVLKIVATRHADHERPDDCVTS